MKIAPGYISVKCALHPTSTYCPRLTEAFLLTCNYWNLPSPAVIKTVRVCVKSIMVNVDDASCNHIRLLICPDTIGCPIRYDWLSNPIRPVVRADTSACLGLYVRLSFGLSNELSNDASSSIFVKCPFDSVQRLILDNQSLIDVPNIHGYHSMLLETVHFVPHHAVECSGFVQMVYSWGCVKNRYNG